MFRISTKSFLLGLGIGIILVSGLNLVVNTYNEKNIFSQIGTEGSIETNTLNRDTDFLILIDSDAKPEDIVIELNKNGCKIDKEQFIMDMAKVKFKEGLYKINTDYSLEDILSVLEGN